MHRSVVKAALPALAPALSQQARAQSTETGHAVYAGSIKPRARIRLQRLRAHRREDGKPPGRRLGNTLPRGEAHRPAVGPEGCRSDDIRRCVKMAMDPWEGALPLPGTITIHSRLNEGPSPAVGVGGAVTYPSAGGAATPASPYCQHSPRQGRQEQSRQTPTPAGTRRGATKPPTAASTPHPRRCAAPPKGIYIAARGTGGSKARRKVAARQ